MFGYKKSALTLLLLATLLLVHAAHAVTVFSEGMLTPETISSAPAGFGAFAGDYFVPDFARGSPDTTLRNIWRVPQTGGAPALFANNPSSVMRGGIFLPDGWGANSGKFATMGADPSTQLGFPGGGRIDVFQADGVRNLFLSIPAGPSEKTVLNTPRIVPSGFGTFEGQLAVGDQTNNRVLAVAPDATFTTLVADLPFSPAGLAFAPSTFGAVGGRLLVSDVFSGQISAAGDDGSISTFATVPLLAQQTGLRQLEFTPADFLIDLGIPGELLLVSVSGSQFGGGVLGDVLALDSDGDIVASLRVRDVLGKFDPRGMHFRSDNSLLISDAADPIILATAADFRPGRFANEVPEPATLMLLALGFVLMLRTVTAREELRYE